MDAPTSNDGRGWVRGLRPIFYWLLLVLVLYGIRTHERLMETTRLEFNVTLQGQATDASATFDGKPAFSGQNISLGNHTFMVTHPKGETFISKMFVWYGDHNLGTIDLKRTMGILAVTANPPAPYIFIRGPEWSVTLTNSSGLTQSVPTDQYTIESRYAHWGHADDVTVFADSTAAWRIAPRLGAVQLSCNQSNATFQLLTLGDQQLETGEFPALITELPEGNYKLISQHHGHESVKTLPINAGMANYFPVEFQYGAAVLETEPLGADVQDNSGRYWGITPFILPELLPGTLKLTLHRAGYEPVTVSLKITANQTATFQTNLVSTGYTGAMKAARQYMDASDYNKALQAVGDALVAKPDDAEAMDLKREATGFSTLQHAKELGAGGDYIDGGKELTLALQSLPDNGEIKQLIADYKQHEPKQIEREQVERLNRPRLVFDNLLGYYPDASLFDDHELKTSKPANEVVSAIEHALQSVQPPYVMNRDESHTSEIHLMVATQKFSNGFMANGERMCLIVVGQTKDDESQILFKVLEYQRKQHLDFNVPINQMPVSEGLTPISPSRFPNMTDKLKAQLQEGVSNVTAIVQGAIGQTPAPAVQPAVSQ